MQPSLKNLGKFLLTLSDHHVTCLAGGCTAKQCADLDPLLDAEHARVNHIWHSFVRRPDSTEVATHEHRAAAKRSLNITEDSSLPFVEERACGSSRNRPPTVEELHEAVAFSLEDSYLFNKFKEAEAKWMEHHSKCKHKVSIDYPGMPYNLRHCFACKTSQGLV